MKYFAIFTLLLVALVALTSAQCPQRPRNPSCRGARDEGHRGRGCRQRNMWYYDQRSRQCIEFGYWGCGGNNNRHCSRRDCERQCRR